eukprot:CAMPEP_0197073342 /NCGR_PEP_ID=MMETSP1384-20130603/210558_1 /TAXON_ID=29189 /ORGANISM="Ammonia sp." /LENGTH=442 /DNA_ID=CAMNT_0042512179 /DNA_START=324 /DNA_END=1652 /DNA_ORIENTATION=-
MILLPQSHTIAINIFRTDSVALTFIIAMLLFTIMDISFYLLLRPLQALIWDITMGNKASYMDTMKVFNIVQGVCRMSGLVIVAICISFNVTIFGTHIAAAFTLGSFIIFICSFFSLFYSPNPPELDSITAYQETIPFANSAFTSNLYTTFDADALSDCYASDTLMDTDEIKHLLFAGGALYKSTDVIHDDDEYNTDEDNDSNALLFANNANHGDSSKYHALYLLWLSQLSGWCSMCCIILFWTSFISIDVYHGIAIDHRLGNLHQDTYEWQQFKAGVVFGAYGLLLTALISVNCSVLYPWLRKRISTRALYMVGELMMALLCVSFYVTESCTLLLILISVFGLAMQIHMQSCHELTENELQPMFAKMRESKTKVYFSYCMELANVIAPVAVSLFGGPMVYAFNGEFKYLFLLAGVIQLIFDSIVLCMFCNVFPCTLPRANYS